MSLYRKVNNITGWLVFMFALVVYTLTIESTVSLWDCGEFISGAYKLQIVHSPGAPLFLMIGRLFTMLVDREMVPVMINFLAGLCSALAVLFLFWCITHLARKTIVKAGEMISISQIVAIMGSGVVGALSCTFAESFWFSAAEGEVYAMSAFFTAIVFWAALKWQATANKQYADRWLILIAYLMGLSIGVHLLNLLTIPAIVFIYYFKKYELNRRGVLFSFLISVAILAFVQFGIIQVLPKIASWFELRFVNNFGLPFNSGLYFSLILLVGAIGFGLYYTTQKKKYLLNSSLLAVTFIIIGYSSYAMVMIRANANPSINMSHPSDLFSFVPYLAREQYGQQPILYGPYYTAKRIDTRETGMRYYKDEEEGIYKEIGQKIAPVWDPEHKTIFPRMWSSQGRHTNFYNWHRGVDTKAKNIPKPKFSENLWFFFDYQINTMYWRYFLWNLSGRQNDVQGFKKENIKDGNWITGINWIDKQRLGSQEELPSSRADNKARNRFYMLPFLLGLLGMIYHFGKNKKDASIVMMLFFFTGIAIILFLNQQPYQPRERDYGFAGSIFTFAIWIGMGVLALYDLLRNSTTEQYKRYALGVGVSVTFLSLIGFSGYDFSTFIFLVIYLVGITALLILVLGNIGKRLKEKLPGAAIVCILGMTVPFLMAWDGWDDHNRHGRYTARDFAINYLESLAPNAIIFTQGDNDTYPLWHAQEVLGFRTDVRVVNLSLLAVDWYIDHLHRKANDADAIKLTHTMDTYRGNKRDYLPFYDDKKYQQDKYYDLKKVVQFIASDEQGTKVRTQQGISINYLPVKRLTIPIDPAKAIAMGMVAEKDKDKIVSIKWELNKNTLFKNDLLTLDILANNIMERPIYFAVSVSSGTYLGLEEYLQLEGLAYRIVPVKSPTADRRTPGRVNTAIMYDNLMHKFLFGGVDKGELYLNENVLRMTMNLRSNYARLAMGLIAEGKKTQAIEVLDTIIKAMPHINVPYDPSILMFIELYYRAGAPERTAPLREKLMEIYEENLRYFVKLERKFMQQYKDNIQQGFYVFQQIGRFVSSYEPGNRELLNQLNNKILELAELYRGKGIKEIEPLLQQLQQRQQQQQPREPNLNPLEKFQIPGTK